MVKVIFIEITTRMRLLRLQHCTICGRDRHRHHQLRTTSRRMWARRKLMLILLTVLFTSCDADAAAATVFYTTEHDECVNNRFFVLSASENFSVQVNHLLEYGKMYSRLRNTWFSESVLRTLPFPIKRHLFYWNPETIKFPAKRPFKRIIKCPDRQNVPSSKILIDFFSGWTEFSFSSHVNKFAIKPS